MMFLNNPKVDWSYTSEPQPELLPPGRTLDLERLVLAPRDLFSMIFVRLFLFELSDESCLYVAKTTDTYE